uniref:Uncharacterized protein n=1 Tax=Timema bartmani TaxID=61472 RepID=A0A7R9EX68_9NEOP|nr:unnamed protein product [Timema bartmani]
MFTTIKLANRRTAKKPSIPHKVQNIAYKKSCNTELVQSLAFTQHHPYVETSCSTFCMQDVILCVPV